MPTQRATRSNANPPWWQGWGPLVLLPLAAGLVSARGPRWALMWSLAAAIYAGCKWLTWRRTPAPEAPWWKHLGYLIAWPGLDARGFLGSDSAEVATLSEWLFAWLKSALGVLLLAASGWIPEEQAYVTGWVGMIGTVFILHFGLFHLLSCFWRSVGVDAQPLMDWPIAATSVSEFWSRRWNRAFRDLTHRFLFRPLAASFGSRPAIAAGFLFSGLVHDVVVSL